MAQLDRSHSTLVEAAISVPWTMMDEAFANAYMRFVQALLCSRSEFVQTTLEKIIKGFRFRQLWQPVLLTDELTKILPYRLCQCLSWRGRSQ